MKYKYDITLSFAGEDRIFVEEVANCLQANGVKVFYDKFVKEELWGKNLFLYLDDIYRKQSKYCIMFLSKHYAKKIWTNHERESAQAKAFQQNEEYILPVKIDDTEIPGIRPTTGYLDIKEYGPKEICSAALKKLGLSQQPDNIPKDKSLANIRIPKIKRTITDLEKKQFLNTSFTEIMDYFVKGLLELKKVNPHVETDFERISDSKYIASVYVEGNLKNQCKIWISSAQLGHSLGISYSEGSIGTDALNDNILNDRASILDDGLEIFFDVLGMAFGFNFEGLESINLKHASAQDVAKYYWGRFTQYLNN